MKNINKRLVSLFLAVVLVIGLATPLASAANPAPNPGTAKWTDIGGNIKCYTRSTGNTITYSSAELGTRSGYVDGVDEIIVKVISTNSKGHWYAKINYKVNSGGTKDAYVPLSAVCISTSAQAGVEKRAGVNIPIVYKRPGEKYVGSSIDAGDDVYIIGTSGAYTQVMYPIGHNGRNPGLNSNTWKLGWIKTVDAQHSLVSKQDFSSWSGTSYGQGYNEDTGKWYKATIGGSGCGLLAIANAVYYLNGKMIPPEELALYALAKHPNNTTERYRVDGSGTKSTLTKGFCRTEGSKYGILCVTTIAPSNYNNSSEVLAQIRPYLTGEKGGHGKCVAVVNVRGHFVAVVDYNSQRGYLVYDSAASNIWTNENCYKWMKPSAFTGYMNIFRGADYEIGIIGNR